MAFSHLDEKGRARMVDVSGKPDQRRTAVASGRISLSSGTIEAIREQNIAKGDALTVAKVAGIQAAKRTSELIPLCHNIPLTDVSVGFEMGDSGIDVTASASCVGKTGVEMEALTAVSTALLAIYDMCKAIDEGMTIGGIRLVSKEKR